MCATPFLEEEKQLHVKIGKMHASIWKSTNVQDIHALKKDIASFQRRIETLRYLRRQGFVCVCHIGDVAL
jgi:hypothetical protein